MGRANKRRTATSPPADMDRKPAKRPRAAVTSARPEAHTHRDTRVDDAEQPRAQTEQTAVRLDRLERNLDLMVRRVRSALKDARKGEVLRAIKRLQAVRQADPTAKERKEVDMLAQELEATKRVPLDTLAHRVVGRKLVRSRLVPKASRLGAALSDGLDERLTAEFPLLAARQVQPGGQVRAAVTAPPHPDLQERVYERFTSARPVAAAATAGVEQLERILGRGAHAPGAPESQKSSKANASRSRPAAPKETEQPAESDDEPDHQNGQDDVPQFGAEWDALVGSGSEGEHDEDDNDDGPLPESDYSDAEADETPDEDGTDQDQGTHGPDPAEQDLNDDGSEDSDSDSDSGSDASSSEGGLPSLAAGYVDRGVRLSGKGDASDYSDDDDQADHDAPVRRNRMGQRARRALWEKKFGKGAKHVQTQQARKERERDAKRPVRGAGRARGGAAAGANAWSSGPASRLGTSSNDTPLGPKATARSFPDASPVPAKGAKPTKDDKPMHPSWVAKQQQKKQAEAKPQGKKVVFD